MFCVQWKRIRLHHQSHVQHAKTNLHCLYHWAHQQRELPPRDSRAMSLMAASTPWHSCSPFASRHYWSDRQPSNEPTVIQVPRQMASRSNDCWKVLAYDKSYAPSNFVDIEGSLWCPLAEWLASRSTLLYVHTIKIVTSYLYFSIRKMSHTLIWGRSAQGGFHQRALILSRVLAETDPQIQKQISFSSDWYAWPIRCIQTTHRRGNDVGRHIACRDNRNCTSAIEETPTLTRRNHCRQISRPRDMTITLHLVGHWVDISVWWIRLPCVKATSITNWTTRVLLTTAVMVGWSAMWWFW